MHPFTHLNIWMHKKKRHRHAGMHMYTLTHTKQPPKSKFFSYFSSITHLNFSKPQTLWLLAPCKSIYIPVTVTIMYLYNIHCNQQQSMFKLLQSYICYALDGSWHKETKLFFRYSKTSKGEHHHHKLYYSSISQNYEDTFTHIYYNKMNFEHCKFLSSLQVAMNKSISSPSLLISLIMLCMILNDNS